MRRIVEDDLSGAAIRALLTEHFEAMLANSPAGMCHFLDFEGLKAPGVTFWSAHEGGALVACGAMKRLSADHGELKSMRTHRDHLRRGHAAGMLAHIADVARAEGMTRLSLETGTGPAFEPAIALYTAHGFERCEPFADYVATDFNIFLTRRI